MAVAVAVAVGVAVTDGSRGSQGRVTESQRRVTRCSYAAGESLYEILWNRFGRGDRGTPARAEREKSSDRINSGRMNNHSVTDHY